MSYLPNTGLVTLGGDVTGPSNANLVGAISGATPTSPVTVTPPIMQWLATSTNPTINQVTTTVATANPFTLQAQNTSGSTGGNLILQSGTGASVPGTLIHKVGTASVLSQALSSADFISFGAVPPSTGAVRLTNNLAIIGRNVGNTADINIALLDASNNITYGGTNSATLLTSTVQTQLTGSSSSLILNSSAAVLNQNNLQFANGTATAPLFSHQTTGSATGSVFTIQAQNAVTTGGNLVLQTGTGTAPGTLIHKIGPTAVLQQALSSSDFISLGSTPPTTGAFRLTNNLAIMGRNVGNTADINIALLDASNNITFGGTNSVTQVVSGVQTQMQVNSNQVLINASSIQNKYAGTPVFYQGQSSSDFISFGATPATSGTIRLSNNQPIFARNVGNTANATLLSYDVANNLSVGDATNVAVCVVSSSTQTQLIGSTGALTVNGSAVVVGSANLQFTLGINNPTIAPQTTPSNSITATPLTIQGQNAPGASTIGGSVIIKPGTGTSSNGGNVLAATNGGAIFYTDNNKASFATGIRRHITYVATGSGSYQTLATDDIVIYDCGNGVAPVLAFILPNHANATQGDQYEYSIINLPANTGNPQSVAVVSFGGATNIFIPTLTTTVSGQSMNQGSAGSSFGRLRFTWSGSTYARWICDIYA